MSCLAMGLSRLMVSPSAGDPKLKLGENERLEFSLVTAQFQPANFLPEQLLQEFDFAGKEFSV
jgi:hypothetical protein